MNLLPGYTLKFTTKRHILIMNNRKISHARRAAPVWLKPFAGTFLFALAMHAHALDFTPDASRELSDPAYLPLQDQFVSTTSLSLTRTRDEVYDYLGALKNSNTVRSTVFTQTFADGITDDLTLRLTTAYGHTKSTSNPPGGTPSSTFSHGLDDPVVGLTWRALDQKEHAVNWDLIASYAPDLVQAIAATPTQVGSVARGGQATTVETAVSYKTRDFTLYVDGGATYLSTRTLSDNINIATTYTPYWQYFLGLNTQTRLSETIAIDAGVSGTYSSKYQGAIPGTVVAFDVKAGSQAAVHVALAYNVTPNKLAATFTFSHSIYASTSVDFATQPALSTTTRNRKANALDARLQYLFD